MLLSPEFGCLVKSGDLKVALLPLALLLSHYTDSEKVVLNNNSNHYQMVHFFVVLPTFFLTNENNATKLVLDKLGQD